MTQRATQSTARVDDVADHLGDWPPAAGTLPPFTPETSARPAGSSLKDKTIYYLRARPRHRALRLPRIERFPEDRGLRRGDTTRRHIAIH